jgi:hypothetical protein
VSASQAYACCSRTRTRLEKGTRGGVSVVVAGAVQASVPVKLSWRRHDARDLRASSSASCLIRNQYVIHFTNYMRLLTVVALSNTVLYPATFGKV